MTSAKEYQLSRNDQRLSLHAPEGRNCLVVFDQGGQDRVESSPIPTFAMDKTRFQEKACHDK
ncbi:hypothetical protein [Pseudomonas sp. MWU13-2105]|uniref:hypothetical protein n=1 Tax=Pseudomonas sp. MWU13-2105 TaxID=2935074 RepID=UPI00200D1345|nr:hypothetical protein [Pseudomonas sp. MWU13-2105]